MSAENKSTDAPVAPATQSTAAPPYDGAGAPGTTGNATAHEGERHHQGHDLPAHGHNPSVQRDVNPNPDLALHFSHEHQHDHMHHGASALAGKHDDILYAHGTTVDQHIDTQDHSHTVHHHAKHAHVGVDSKDQDLSEHDPEKGDLTPTKVATNETEDGRRHRFSRFYAKYKIFFHIAIWLVWTGWWIAGLILHRNDNLGWLKPFLLYLAITIRIITFWVPAALVLKPVKWAWDQTGVRVYNVIPEKFRIPAAAAVTIAVFLVGSMVSEESANNTRGNRAISLVGLGLMIAILWATSRDRRKIRWHTVIGGMLTQFIISVFVLRTDAGYDIFNFISFLARSLLGFAQEGTAFLTSPETTELPWFLIGVVPPIIFFVALVQLLYYSGLLQWFVGKFAVFFFWSLRVSGAEAVVAAATPFIGQGESAMLIRPFVPHLTMADIGLGLNPQALVSSCIMSIPASLAVSKMRYPETEETITSGRVVVPDDDEHRATNALHAFANGAWLGIKIAGMIVSTLLCIIAFIGLINGLLGWWGRYLNITEDGGPYLTLQLLLGYIMYPVAFFLGVPRNELLEVAELIGVKIIANEFVAYNSLVNEPRYSGLSPRSQLIATYALCVSYHLPWIFPSPRSSKRRSPLTHSLRRVSATLVLLERRSVCSRRSPRPELATSRLSHCQPCFRVSSRPSPRLALRVC
jgi:concentrative nucleoside transporter, CNT family